ncbi:MAG: FliM/FliN family flagellar motor switch protein, partial [candidate division WOR-3 bacterium]
AERILMTLRGAWESILSLDPRVEELETSAQFVQVAPPNDIVITVVLEGRVGEQRGAMSLCIPYMVIKPITPKLSSRRWIASSGKQSSHQSRQLISAQLNHVTLPCIVRLGSTRLRLQQLLNLKVGEILVLNTPVHGTAEIWIGGRVRFRGRPAVRNRKLVLAITEVVSEV